MKVTIKDMMEDSMDELTLWIDGDGDINLKINDQRTVCLTQNELRDAIKFANKNQEENG